MFAGMMVKPQTAALYIGYICQAVVLRNFYQGLSTACFSMGLEKGMEFIENLSDTEAVFITEDNELHFSSGMGKTVPYEIFGFIRHVKGKEGSSLRFKRLLYANTVGPVSFFPQAAHISPQIDNTLCDTRLYYSQVSGGGFDITVGNLTSLWDFSQENPAVPKDSDIKLVQ